MAEGARHLMPEPAGPVASTRALPRVHAIVGHDAIRGFIAGAQAGGTLPAGLLLHGPAGVGKQRLALWTAQLLLCREPTPAGPCETCVPCRQARRLEHPDLHWFFPVARPKGASSPERLKAGLEDARAREITRRVNDSLYPSWTDELQAIYLASVQTLRQLAAKRPAVGDAQVFIVGNAEALVPQESSPAAANALLKVLEEPPDGTTFILTSSEPEKLLPTIRSRVVGVHVPPLSIDEAIDFLTEHSEADAVALQRAAHLAQGSVGAALAYLPDDADVGPLEAVRRDAWAVLQAACSDQSDGAYRSALARSPAGGRTLGPLFDHLGVWVRDLAAVTVGAEDEVINVDALNALRSESARGGDVVGFAKAIERIEEARVLASGNVNPQLVLFGLISELAPLLGPTGAAS